MEMKKNGPQRGVKLQPLDIIDGFKVRPGFYNRDGAAAAPNGVSFTIHSSGATSCTLLLFRPREKEPYAKLKFPEAYHIGNTYSMLVFDLKIEYLNTRSSWTALMIKKKAFFSIKIRCC